MLLPTPDQDALAALLVQPAGRARKLARHYVDSLPAAGHSMGLRPEKAGDLPFLHALYASTRTSEMALVDWPEQAQRSFLLQQSSAQLLHYRKYYDDACFLVCEHNTQPVGRIYLHQSRSELRVMDIALLTEFRGQGLGRVLMGAVVRLANAEALAVGLHVEPNNPARDWYLRLGFEDIEAVGAYIYMRLQESGLAQAQEKLIS